MHSCFICLIPSSAICLSFSSKSLHAAGTRSLCPTLTFQDCFFYFNTHILKAWLSQALSGGCMVKEQLDIQLKLANDKSNCVVGEMEH